jgi:hypothetical protein
MPKETLHTLFTSPNIIERDETEHDEMCGICRNKGRDEKFIQNAGPKSEGKIPLDNT